MYTLYYSPGACSRACHVVLEELKVPFETKFINVQKGEGQDPSFLKINPRGQVPTLQDGDFVLTEGVAILEYLCAQHADKSAHLMPASAQERAISQQWLMYVNSTLHPLFGSVFGAPHFYTDAAVIQAIKESAYARLAKAFTGIEEYLGSHKFLGGDRPSTADIMFTVVASWAPYIELPYAYGPNVTRVLNAVKDMPSYKAVEARETAAYAAKQAA